MTLRQREIDERADDTRPLGQLHPRRDYGTTPLAEEGQVSTHHTSLASSTPTPSALRSTRGLAAYAQRDIGRVREINQDSVFALLSSLPRESANVPMGLFVVADGMGGHEGGEVASRMAVRMVAHYVLEHLLLPALDESFGEALQSLMIAALTEANSTIFREARALGSDMGTTCSAALLLGGAVYVAHVGDSRVYLRTPAGLRQLSTDHSAVGRLIEVGQLTPEEAQSHPLRSQIYRTIGQQPSVVVDFVYQPLGDATHLLLCSDGLWSMIDQATMSEVLEQCVWPQDACQELIARANLAGGDDNIGAVVVTLPPPGRHE